MNIALAVILLVIAVLYLKRLCQSKRVKQWPNKAKFQRKYTCIKSWKQTSYYSNYSNSANPSQALAIDEYFAVMEYDMGSYEMFETKKLFEEGQTYILGQL